MSSLIFVASLFAFLIEGVITPVIYEAGLFDPIMPAYFIGWHGLLSFVFGWYLIRKWLVQGQWLRLLIGSTLFGIFWGGWSLTYWLPENVAEWEYIASIGEPTSGSVFWTENEFGLYTLIFTLMLALSHIILGYGGWQKQFKPSKIEQWGTVIALVTLFTLIVFPIRPLAIIKLIGMLGILFVMLRLRPQGQSRQTIFSSLSGSINPVHLLCLLIIPLTATTIYTLAIHFRPPEALLQSLSEDIPLLQACFGGILFLWAIGATLWSHRKNSKLVTS